MATVFPEKHINKRGRPRNGLRHVTKTDLLKMLKSLQKDLTKALSIMHEALSDTDPEVRRQAAKWTIGQVVVVGREYERPASEAAPTEDQSQADTIVTFNMVKK